MPSVYVVEPFWTGVKHARFNSAFLAVLTNIFPGEQIHFFAESKHLQAVRGHLQEKGRDIQLDTIYLPYQDKKYKIPWLYLASFFQVLKTFISVPRDSLLFFSSMNAIVLTPLYLVNFIFRRRILIVTHGELSFLDKRVSQKLNGHYKLQAAMFRGFFKRALSTDRIFFIVLGKFIYRSLKEYIPGGLLERKVLIMEHPYLFPKQATLTETMDENKLNLAIVGLATRSKGSDKIVELYNGLLSRNLQHRVTLSIVGKVVDFAEDLGNTNIRFFSQSDFIEQQQYDRLIAAQDFILFFYPDETYKLTASGAFLDCILHNKPVIAIRNDFFSYYMETVGRFGYLVESVDEIADLIGELLHVREENDPPLELEKMKAYFSPEVIAQMLRMQLFDKGLISYP